ncbi:ABC transporter ATP-binding protein [Bacillus sp. FJAT-49711]|uniref:ABC transporter ATP-binding protein n=1 Tax=Bacillus sp. FJAT-49711 TaxID=2833585 RepID=UPI001BC9AD7B|nr:ABC transporter ATP-binding protein [Bacillus sp. FJAT-49711]MBS4216775.1 ABC transporter ATP-binding protein [Bacillus sp. FJAT-49711]
MNLTIDHLTKRYGKHTALDNFTCDFTSGVYGILGANGSGKTTLMRMLATVTTPSSGIIQYNGKNIFELGDDYRDVIGYLPQYIGLYKNFTAEKFLHYIAALKGLDQKYASLKVNELLELVNLSDVRKKKVGTFSGGMKQRIGIAQALLNDPKILIVDEPTAGLDPKERIRFRNLLSAISGDRIVLLSTHIVSDIEFIAKEILILKSGRLLHKQDPQKLLSEISEKVWLLQVSEKEIAKYQTLYKVGNIVRSELGAELRIISDERPSPAAVLAKPNLEDLYLYYFEEDQDVSAAQI